MDTEPSPSQTVKFNVSGRVFEVSRGLIDQQPGSVLGRMISETWHRDQEEPLFVDRNGDIFAQVLEYLRYGSIVLPSNMPKEMFTRDLDYYGLDYDAEAIIDGDMIIAELKDGHAKKLKAMEEENAKNLKAMLVVEITGRDRHPIYARGNLAKDWEGEHDQEHDQLLNLHEVSACLLKDLEAVEIWIGGSLNRRFAELDINFVSTFNIDSTDTDCHHTWLWIFSREMIGTVRIVISLPMGEVNPFYDGGQYNHSEFLGLLENLAPGTKCSFTDVSFKGYLQELFDAVLHKCA